MALRKIVEQGDDCLTKVCRPVTDFNARLHQLLDDMAETLEEADFLAAEDTRVTVKLECCAGSAWCWTRMRRSIWS